MYRFGDMIGIPFKKLKLQGCLMLRILSFLLVGLSAVSASANICIPGKGNLLQVVNVASDDTLNVRSGWTTDYEVLFELSPDQKDIFYNDVAYKSDECLSLCRRYLRGEDNLRDTIKSKCRNKSRIWYRITLSNGDTGWASGKYLLEYQSETLSIRNGVQIVSNAESVREAEEKRRAEEERLAREAEEKRRAEEERLAREAEEKRLATIQSNYGFKDIKPGMSVNEVMNSNAGCNLATGLNFKKSTNCYGIENIKFVSNAYTQTSIFDILGLDLGVLDSYGWASYILADTDPESGNIYTSMRKNLDEKYSLEYEFTERDLDFFNNSERDILRVVYEQGQVALQVERVKVDDWNNDIRLRLYYRNPEKGTSFYKRYKPKKASASDF